MHACVREEKHGVTDPTSIVHGLLLLGERSTGQAEVRVISALRMEETGKAMKDGSRSCTTTLTFQL